MSRRRKIWVSIATVVVVAGAFGLYWFQPWKLFIDHRVNEELPAAATEPVEVAIADESRTPQPPASGGAGGSAAGTSTPAAPSAGSAQADVRLLSRGSLISHEHDTSGTVSVLRRADGGLELALAKLDTSDGPDVHVWLSDQPVKKGDWYNLDDGKHVDLGGLKGNLGNQLYRIPKGTDLTRFTTVSIWCERFDVSFGAATLRPVG